MASSPNQSEQNVALVNWPAALEAACGDRHLLNDLVDISLKEIPVLMSAIHRAINDSNADVLRRSAFTLRSSLRVFESTGAIKLAQHLEDAGESQDLTEAPSLAALLNPLMDAVVAELQKGPTS